MRPLPTLWLAPLSAFAQTGGWGPAASVPALNSPVTENAPNLAQDGLTLRWSSNRTDIPGSPGANDIYEASRPHRHGSFGAVTRVPGAFNTANFDLTCHVMASETLAWVANNTLGNYEIFEVTRSGPMAPWGAPVLAAALSSAAVDWSPSVTADGLLLTFTSSRSANNFDVWQSTRAALEQPWGAPTPVAELSSANPEFEVCVSPDGLTCYVSQNVASNRDLYWSTRKLRTDPWSTPVLVPNVNSPQLDQGPSISADGRELWFHSSRGGNPDLHVARWTGLTHQNLPQSGFPLLIHLTLPALAGQSYLVAAALSSAPGIPVPGVGTIPLALDPLLLLSISGQLPAVFTDFSGTIDANGEATATFHIPPGVPVGFDFSIAAVTYDGSGIVLITNGEDLKVNP